MADSVSEGSGSDEYECKICYNDFDLERRVPKLLGCSHTFCQECLEVLHSREGGGWRVGCPVCRHRTPVREYKVQNLPSNSSLSERLQRKQHNQHTNSPRTEEQAAPAGSPPTSQQASESCETCRHVAFITGCVCAMFSFLSMVALLFVGLIFMHNSSQTSPFGPICLFIASVLAPFSLILTWFMCMMKYRPSPNLSSPTSNRL